MTAQSSALSYIPGESEEAKAANQAYQDALKKMVESLDARRNRMFDPTLLAMAQGFLTPGRTGSFGESLGQVAGNVRAAETESLKEEQAAAEAGLKVQQMNMQAIRDRQNAQYIMSKRAAAKAGAPGTTGAVAGAVPGAPSGSTGYKVFEGQGDPTDEITEAAVLSRLSPAEYQKLLQDANAKRYEKTEGGMYDLWTGMFIPALTGKTVEFNGKTIPEAVMVQIASLMREGKTAQANELFNQATSGISTSAALSGAKAREEARVRREEETKQVNRSIPGFGTIELPEQTAFEYDKAVRQFGVNSQQARSVIAPYLGGSPAPAEAPAQAPAAPAAAPAAPTAAPAAAPAGAPSAAVLSAEEREIRQKENEKRRLQLAEESAKAEAQLPARYQNAQSLVDTTSRVLRSVNQSPNYFGLFERPGVVSALGKIINEGVQTPSGSLRMSGFEDAVRQAMPRATQEHLNNVKLAGADLAEVELQFTKQYLAKQGAVTEGERKIVRAVPGTVSSSADVLRTRMQLLQERAKFDRAEISGFQEFKRSNPTASYLDWQNSEGYKRLLDDFSEKSEKIYEDMLSSNAKKPVIPNRPAGVPSNWKLQQDAKGNKAWVDPNNPRNFREVQ